MDPAASLAWPDGSSPRVISAIASRAGAFCAFLFAERCENLAKNCQQIRQLNLDCIASCLNAFIFVGIFLN